MAKKNKKPINIEGLSPEELENLSVELGEEIRDLCDAACLKANKLIKKYGLKVKMGFVIEQLESGPVDSPLENQENEI